MSAPMIASAMRPLRLRFCNSSAISAQFFRSFMVGSAREGKGKSKPLKVLKKAGIMLERRVSGTKHRKEHWYSSPLGISALTQMSGTKKGPNKGVQRRSHQLSVVMTHYVTSLIYSGEIDQRLVEMNVEIVKVKMASDLSALHVYWMGSGSTQDAVIQDILQEASYKLRHVLTGLHLLGSVPPVVFIKDLSATRLQEVQHLLEIADMGPDHETSDLGEEMRSDTVLPKPEQVSLQEKIDSVSKKFADMDLASFTETASPDVHKIDEEQFPYTCDGNVKVEDLSDIDVTLRSDIYDLDHTSLTKQILDNKRNIFVRPTERTIEESPFTGFSEKKFSKDELKKLLSKRMEPRERRPYSERHLSSQLYQIEDKESDKYDIYEEDDDYDDSMDRSEYDYPNDTK